ncbi:STAS domain-containing protein [Pseudomonas putida]|nr:STAS domain-containing protein [Pseudomonas putida]
MDTPSPPEPQPPKPQAYAAEPTLTGWQRWVPGWRVLRQYPPGWLPKDLVAGLVLTAMLVPVGIAYAQASGVPGIHGLYATIVPLLAYAVFGPSRILVLGPDSALVPIILAVVLPLAAGDPGRAVTLAAAMALVSGLICVGAGLLRLGFITELLSKPAKTRTQVDPNQEMVGLGLANLATGLFQGIAVSSSSSRTPVAEAAGARSQLAGVFGALGVALLLLLAPDLLRHLPQSALAAVVIAAALGLFEFKDLGRIYRIQRWEFWLSITCFVGVAVFGAVPGIGLAVVIAVIEFLWDGWRPHYAVLGRADGVRGYHDVARYPHARRVPGLVLFRWDAPLFFANAELFQRCVLEAVARSGDSIRRVIVAAEPVSSVDVTSADMLVELQQALREAGVELHFAEVKDPVRDKLLRLEVLRHIGNDIFHPTVGAAVEAYLEDHGVDWTP